MEENEMPVEQTATETPQTLVIDETSRMFLFETAKWGRFLGIVGFVACGFLVIVALFLIFVGGAVSTALEKFGGMAGMMTGFTSSVYLLMAVIYYLPSKYLYDFAVYIKQALIINDQESLTYAFSRLKALYRFWGILMIILLAFYGLIIVFAVLVGGFAASQLHGA
ncbi:hypothetical protein N9R54_05215, partial [Pelobium sp.]